MKRHAREINQNLEDVMAFGGGFVKMAKWASKQKQVW